MAAGITAAGQGRLALLPADIQYPCLRCLAEGAEGRNTVAGRGPAGQRVRVACPRCGGLGTTPGLDYCGGTRHASGQFVPVTHVIVRAAAGHRGARLVCQECAEAHARQTPDGEQVMAFALAVLPGPSHRPRRRRWPRMPGGRSRRNVRRPRPLAAPRVSASPDPQDP